MKLEDIMEELKQDSRNQSYTEKGVYPILQVHPNAKILIIGQAPGSHVERTMIPFDDASGERLRKWMNVSDTQFYGDEIAILPMDLYYPGKGKTGDLPPRKFIAQEYHERLLAQMPNIQLTLLVGKYAIDYYLHDTKKKNLTETVRNYKEYLPKYFPTVHPSPLNFRWFKKNPWFEEENVKQLQQMVDKIINTK
ncbi:MAG: uracil-DNA glycosylase family protein [Erysipelotrichaceae bacterium]|nr:uracil-DNA glycosylase family protein [Erysipelotrichaceae bacterium]MDY6034338.1 uracil-DNA glycosylase family protein [Bulleidia sp.]